MAQPFRLPSGVLTVQSELGRQPGWNQALPEDCGGPQGP